MSDQEILSTAETQSENPTLFDELAGLVPEERQAEHYRVIAHTRTLTPNDEMLRILEAMGVLALLTIVVFLFAWRKLRVGPPTPQMAIDEAKRIKDTVATTTQEGA